MKKGLLKRALRVRTDCGYCAEPVSYEHYGASFATLDHITPKARGGTDARSNLTVACLGCNRAKAHASHWPAPAYTLADILPAPVTHDALDDDDDWMYDE